ncbi:MAG: zinc metallopeptidase [Clostridiales bacterium]|nr:zinc metallopeptidase [Clostridiales bacterium]
MPFFYVDRYYIIFVLPALIFAIIAQISVKSNFKKYSKISNSKGLTGADAAMNVLRQYGIFDVRIERVAGKLTDHFDPKNKVIRLSQEVYDSSSVAAIGVACHEAGHAAQYAQGYSPIKIRNFIIPVCNVGSYAGIPLAIIGIIFSSHFLFVVGLLLYALVALFQFVTLPVEFDASHRAIKAIEEGNMLYDEEIIGAKKVLKAAALTYVAALATSLANILRLIALANRRN